MIKEKKVNKMNWYVVKTQNNKERSVLEKLRTDAKFSNLEDRIGEVIIPMENTVVIKEGKRVIKEKIMYPGYIFIETSSVGEVSNLFKSINGATGFVKTKSGEIFPMKDSEVKKIYVDKEKSESEDFSKHFLVNEEVKIIDGPFATFKGKIIEMDLNKDRVKLEVSIFGRPMVVDTTFSQINKI